ncbi:pentatricopeptide repeat-containing protein At3g50420-like [Curcuma longa]|uniref:pentatricopeptide repeat-containing protein At3g50420-like n=1 Tax=Curcuma longa TaxID=136217 RepID=UPI003D9DEDA1
MASTPFYHYNCEAPLAAVAASLLHRCASSGSSATLRKTRQLHALILIALPCASPPFLFNNILSLYAKCGALGHARKVFDAISARNLVSYNSMIAAYSYSRCLAGAQSALRLFRELCLVGLGPSASTLSSLVRASASFQEPLLGRGLHSKVVRYGFPNNVRVQTALLGMYSDNGSHEAVENIFWEMNEKDVVAWNSIVLSNVKNGSIEHGFRHFCQMIRTGLMPNNSTFSIILNACGKLEDGKRGRIVHAQMLKSDIKPDILLQNALVNMYACCGDMPSSSLVFDNMEKPDLVSWNSLLAGYSDSGEGEKAMKVFIELKDVSSSYRGSYLDDYSFAAVIYATATLPSVCYGRPLHAQTIKSGLNLNIFVANTLINMYFTNGDPDSAQRLFSFILIKDAILWSEMIVGHSKLGEGELAMQYFYLMLNEGHKVDDFSLSNALRSCADLVVLNQGEMVHSLVVKSGYEANICVCRSLIDMYAKNGILQGADSSFCRIKNPDLKCWNSIIGGYGNFGSSEQAFKMFNSMVRNGLQPDHVTYLSLVSACNHSGLVERGRFYWFCMLADGIVPGFKHYACMVNLISRSGLLQEAKQFILGSPFVEASELWRILLCSCIIFRNLEIGAHAAEQALIIEPEDTATYILLSNLYASVGKWDVVKGIKKKVRKIMLDEESDLSWIERKTVVHVFFTDDEFHEHIDECRNELLRLQGNLLGLNWSNLQLYISLIS